MLTSDWVEGLSWADFLTVATPAQKAEAAEILFRFAEGSIWHHRVFNGDPHPGNYRFQADGSITFLDFGLVKRWTPGELESLDPILDHILAADVQGTVDSLIFAAEAEVRWLDHSETRLARAARSANTPTPAAEPSVADRKAPVR